MSEEKRIAQIAIVVGGNDLPLELMDRLVEVEADSSLHLPDVLIMTFHDDELKWIDADVFAIGSPVEVEMAMEDEQTQRVFSGEITAVEPHFQATMTATLVVRCYDITHRLNRGTKSRVFVDMTDSDIAEQIGRENGIQLHAENTTEIYSHVFQDNQSDLSFLQERAKNIGFELYMDNLTVYFRPAQMTTDAPIELEWGLGLTSFTPRLSTFGQVSEVVVKGWDPQTKYEIMGNATGSRTSPQINVGGQGAEVTSQAFSPTRQLVIRHPVATQSEADILAHAILDEINAGFVEAEGVAEGNPRLVAGRKLDIKSIGKRYSGKYTLTSVTHIYAAKGGYESHLRVEGARPKLMADLVMMAPSTVTATGVWAGVVPAIVTNNNDHKNMGRVKVKFPWLDENLESAWARITAVGAGNEYGFFWLPEIDDEVLVAFEHGDFNRPYIIGCLWNGQDRPPEPIGRAVKGGKVQSHTIRTRSGHIIRLSDDDNDQVIEIQDAASGSTITLDAKSRNLTVNTANKIEIKATGNIALQAAGNVEIKASGTVSVEAAGQLNLRGTTVNIN